MHFLENSSHPPVLTHPFSGEATTYSPPPFPQLHHLEPSLPTSLLQKVQLEPHPSRFIPFQTPTLSGRSKWGIIIDQRESMSLINLRLKKKGFLFSLHEHSVVLWAHSSMQSRGWHTGVTSVWAQGLDTPTRPI
ncbi:hypothetical protein CEXT_31121 [Caerostris extrusa]|uniref:Uncharacterized protein n=1 Tax=Caerostris extrusa TaxID=172846 RepID=A0AAV4XH14_CAEEX|nr:hypothetical protein CEXT_31121 [Caerostris extrusa]